jgi:hypothetical protein
MFTNTLRFVSTREVFTTKPGFPVRRQRGGFVSYFGVDEGYVVTTLCLHCFDVIFVLLNGLSYGITTWSKPFFVLDLSAPQHTQPTVFGIPRSSGHFQWP